MHRPDDATDPTIDYRDFRPADWPDVEVLVDGSWRQGELRAWTQRRESGWWGHVQYSMGPAQTYLDTFPADRIREARPLLETDAARAPSQ